MERFWAMLVFQLGAVCSLACAQTPPEAPVLTVYFTERPPFALVEGQSGPLLSLTKAIFTEAGLRPRFIELPSSRILGILRSGPTDAIVVGWYRTPELEVWARPSLPIYQERPIVALVQTRVAAALSSPTRLEGLLSSGLALGMRLGTSLGGQFDQKLRALGVVPLETQVDEGALLRMVAGGRMDYTLLPEEEARYWMSRDSSLASGLTMLRLADSYPGSFRCFISPMTLDSSIASRIDAAIERVRNSPRFRDFTDSD